MTSESNIDIKGWKNAPNSIKFWNGAIMFALIISAIINIEFFGILEFLLSCGTIALTIDDTLDNHFWIVLTPITWAVLLIVLIAKAVMWTYKNTIEKFNNWLDTPKK